MSEGPVSRCRVLVCEDEMLVAMLIEDILEEMGCETVGVVGSVAQALSIIDSGVPLDAAILDINLGGTRSYPVADALSARDTPFLFSTGYSTESVPAQYDAVPRLQKPFRRADLEHMLKEMLVAG